MSSNMLKKHRDKIAVIAAIIVMVAVAVVLIPWSKVGDAIDKGAGMPDQGDTVTFAQARSLTNNNDGQKLYGLGYQPVMTINNHFAWPWDVDDIDVPGVATRWLYGCEQVATNCDEPSTDHPELVTTSNWDGRRDDAHKHSDVKLLLAIMPAWGGMEIRCKLPDKDPTRMLPDKDQDLTTIPPDSRGVANLMESGYPGSSNKLRELTSKSNFGQEPWRCRHYEP